MKISGRNVDVDAKFALNPQVLPFFPRSVATKSTYDDRVEADIDEDSFRWRLAELYGLGVPADLAGQKAIGEEVNSKTAWDKMNIGQKLASGQPYTASDTRYTETNDRTQTCNPLPTTDMDDIISEIIRGNLVDTDLLATHLASQFSQPHTAGSENSSYVGSPSGSKLLDGVWSRPSDEVVSPAAVYKDETTVMTTPHSLLSTARNGDFLAGGKFDTSALVGEKSSNRRIADVENQCGGNYYTPFGSGVTVGHFGNSSQANSVWSAGDGDRNNDTLRSLWNTLDENYSRPTVDSKHTETEPRLIQDPRPIQDQQADYWTRSVAQQTQQIDSKSEFNPHSWSKLSSLLQEGLYPSRDCCGEIGPKKASVTVGHKTSKSTQVSTGTQPVPIRPNHQSGVPQKPTTKTPDDAKHSLPHLLEKEGQLKFADAGKNLTAEQQMFITEINRLPPFLRQQYLDYMTAKQFGMLAVAQGSPAYQPLPEAFYHFDVNPIPMPYIYPQLRPVPVLLPSSRLVPYELATPVFAIPQAGQAVKAIKRTGPANELHARLEECYEQFKQLENERKKKKVPTATLR